MNSTPKITHLFSLWFSAKALHLSDVLNQKSPIILFDRIFYFGVTNTVTLMLNSVFRHPSVPKWFKSRDWQTWNKNMSLNRIQLEQKIAMLEMENVSFSESSSSIARI